MSRRTSSTTHKSLWMPTSFAIIFGSFNLGLFVAIQGPTLMDLIDLLHINNDTMSVTLAFASLAYSVGGLLSGLLFNYVTRPILITILFCCFGLCNIVTPFITNYLVFTVITCLKMICAGGTDCGANVWILDIWPGRDEWLQAVHFTFAVGTALGPLIVEPFLSADYAKSDVENGHSGGGNLVGIKDKTSGSSMISDQNNETRIHVPFMFSGTLSILAGIIIMTLHIKSERAHRRDRIASQHQLELQATGNSSPHVVVVVAPNEQPEVSNDNDEHDDDNSCAISRPAKPNEYTNQEEEEERQKKLSAADQQAATTEENPDYETIDYSTIAQQEPTAKETADQPAPEAAGRLPEVKAAGNDTKATTTVAKTTAAAAAATDNSNQTGDQQLAIQIVPPIRKKITSRNERDNPDERPPYYVMFAVALAAMSLSFYCGVEITSMNYLATFAHNIDLQLSKSTAALMSSALTMSFMVGRGFGIYLGARMKPHKLFYICTFTMIIGNILMLIFANTYEILLWCSVVLFGLGCAPLYPAVVSFFDYKITKVTNTVSGIFISGSMFNVALNSLIIGHHIIDNALILLFCNLAGSFVLLLLFGTLHMLTKVKTNQRVRKYELNQKRSLQLQMQQQSTQTEGEEPEAASEEEAETKNSVTKKRDLLQKSKQQEAEGANEEELKPINQQQQQEEQQQQHEQQQQQQTNQQEGEQLKKDKHQ